MGEIVPFPPPLNAENRDTRRREASRLRDVIKKGRIPFRSGDAERAASLLDGMIDARGKKRGRRGITEICQEIWPGHPNPAQRRRDLRRLKKPGKIAEFAGKIARIIGEPEDDILLLAFRGSQLDDAVRAGGTEPGLEDFWTTLSGTLHVLASEVARVEKLSEHIERLSSIQGRYDLASDKLFPSRTPLLRQPLANWNEHVEDFPPIPSVVLFSEPKSVTVERTLTVRDTDQVIPVQMTVLREVRLAIGPSDERYTPAPLFELRSVLELVGPEGQLRIRTPWLYLDENEVDLNIDGVWHKADIPFDGADQSLMPEGFVDFGGFVEWRFPATLEPELQFEHNYVVWRPVTAGTCREILLRSCYETVLGSFVPEPSDACLDLLCPPGSVAAAIEAALHVAAPDGLPGQLRVEAGRMVAMARAWHRESSDRADAVHRDLRGTWENWT